MEVHFVNFSGFFDTFDQKYLHISVRQIDVCEILVICYFALVPFIFEAYTYRVQILEGLQMNMVKNYFKMLKTEFAGYNAKKLTADLMAGITVAAVALPLALAFGVSSGADAAAGLITAIIAGLVIGALSGGYYQISGPTGAMAAVLMGVVAQYGLDGIFVATFMAGVLMVLASIFKLGKLTSFIPMPVITGFTSGISVIIAMGQIDNFFGVTSQGSTNLAKLASYGTLGFNPNIAAMALGLFVVLFMVFFPKKWNAVVPGSLISIIIATIISVVCKLDVATVGAIPQTLLPETRLTFASIDLNALPNLISPAVSIAILGMIESLLCGASAGRMTGVKLDSDQELMAQGIGNIVLPFFGGIPATAAIARTSVAIKSGAQTRLTGIVHAIALLIFMLVLAPVMSRIPLCALAGVLMVTAWRMNEWHAIKYFFSHKLKSSIALFLLTMIATIVFDLTIAILLGVGAALVFMVANLSNLQINTAKVDPSRMNFMDEEIARRNENALVVYISGPVVFANSQTVEELSGQLNGYDRVYFSMRAVSDVDISGAQALMTVVTQLKEQNCEIIMCGLSDRARRAFDRCDLTAMVGEDHIYWSVDKALLDDKTAAK